MRDRVLSLALLALAGMIAGAPGLAQSLGDLAQKEKEKREAARAGASGGKVYGDGDLATYAGERPAEEGEAPAMSATPKAGSAKKPVASPAPERDKAPSPPEAEDKAAAAESVRARGREAQQRVAAAERTLAAAEEEMKTLPPGLPAGNYYEDIRAAVEQQKVEREYRLDLARKALGAAKEALDAVEIEARRKQIRLD